MPWRIRVVVAGATVTDAPEAIRVLETSQAPAYYVASDHVDRELLRPSDHRTFCEWKGVATYADVIDGPTGTVVAPRAAWTYEQPTDGLAQLVGHWAFYAQAVNECWVDEERVSPNGGVFYGGWITANLTGPFKGAPGTRHW